jgi:hypothetical protein
MLPQKNYQLGRQLLLEFPPRVEVPIFHPRVEVLKSRQMKERFGCSIKLYEIEIGKYVEYKSYRILHKGHDRWEVIRID